MAYTAATALTEVRSIINEPSASFWTDAEILEWIRQGCLDWCEKSLLLIKEDIITPVTNTVKYTTSGSSYIYNAIRTLHAEYDDTALQRITYEQIKKHNARQLGNLVKPAYFYDQYDGLVFTFYLGPIPDATITSDITVLFAMRTDDIEEIPYEYQQTIFLYAIHKAKLKDRQYQEASMILQQYVNNILFARQDSLELPGQSTDSFRIK
jgi:hypothetical protein